MRVISFLLIMISAMPLQAQGAFDLMSGGYGYASDDDGWLSPFDYDFGGYIWGAAGTADISATPYNLSTGNNRYDNYIFETRPVGQSNYLNRFIFRYEYKKQILNSDGSGVAETLQVSDLIFSYRAIAKPVYIDVGWGMRTLSTSLNTEMSPNWYLASGTKLGPKLGIHYQQLSAVNSANKSTEQTLYLDYLVGYKSYLMLGYKQQQLFWAGSNALDMSGYLAGVYFRF